MNQPLTSLPRISIVVPSFNQGQFLDETLRSLFDQRYPDLEVLVIDGGSTDDSVEVIKRYEDKITYWISEKDRGQCDAINKGLARTSGNVIGYLNSDDVLLPGSLHLIGHTFAADPRLEWTTGHSIAFSTSAPSRKLISRVPPRLPHWLLACTIYQPSTFWSRKVYEAVGGLNEEYHFSLDYEYWVRIAFSGFKCHLLDAFLSAYRLHDESKTVAMRERFGPEDEKLRSTYEAKLSPLNRRLYRFYMIRRRCYNAYVQATRLARDGDREEAKRLYVDAVRSQPYTALTRTAIKCAKQIFFS